MAIETSNLQFNKCLRNMVSHAYESYTVEKIAGIKLLDLQLLRRIEKGEIEEGEQEDNYVGELTICYLIKWTGYPDNQNTSEPASELEQNVSVTQFLNENRFIQINLENGYFPSQ